GLRHQALSQSDGERSQPYCSQTAWRLRCRTADELPNRLVRKKRLRPKRDHRPSRLSFLRATVLRSVSPPQPGAVVYRFRSDTLAELPAFPGRFRAIVRRYRDKPDETRASPRAIIGPSLPESSLCRVPESGPESDRCRPG